jgi:hypothetical protein
MSEEPASRAPAAELARLEPFVGSWRTEGEIHGARDAAAATMSASDVYEWLPGRHFLVHRWDAHLPEGRSQGIELVGWDGERGDYAMHSFDSDGNAGAMRARVDGEHWAYDSEALRFRGGFREGGRVFAGTWERRADGGGWTPWMDVTLRRSE